MLYLRYLFVCLLVCVFLNSILVFILLDFPQFVIREKRKSQSWLPVFEKHDIPIVVGVGVSLTFIFITMVFYSLFRKNDPAAITTGRAGRTPKNL